MFNYTASNTDALNATASNKAMSPAAMFAAYGRNTPVTVASTSTLLATNNIVIATTSGVTLTLPLISGYATAQLNTTQMVVYNSSSGSITVQGQSQFPSTAFSITGSTTSGSTYSLDATHLPTVVGGSIATNLFTATADNASAQSFDNVVGSGITALTPQMVLTPGSIFTVDGTSTNTSLVLLNPTSGLLSNGSKIWCDDGGTMKNITAGNVVATTQDNSGAPWVQQTLPSVQNWQAVAYGNGLFVAVVSANNTNIYATSPDGVTWTQRALPIIDTWTSIAFGNGIFMAVGRGGGIVTSPDGISWVQRAVSAGTNWQSVTYGNGLFVVIAYFTSTLASSDGGITWVSGSIPTVLAWSCVTFGNGKFVAVNGNSGNSTTSATSIDGINWVTHSLPVSVPWWYVTYGNGLFVAVARTDAAGNPTNIAASSPDGTTWTQRTLATNGLWESIAFGNGIFMAVAYGNGTTAVSSFSRDSITWTQKAMPNTNGWRGTTWGNGLFVSVAYGANTAAITTASYLNKYTCTALSPSLSNVPTWVAKGGQVLAGSISSNATPNFSAVVPTTYTVTRATNTLTITANQLVGFSSGTHVQLKAQTLNSGDIMSALNAANSSSTINGNTTYTLNAGGSVTLIPTTTNSWIMG